MYSVHQIHILAPYSIRVLEYSTQSKFFRPTIATNRSENIFHIFTTDISMNLSCLQNPYCCPLLFFISQPLLKLYSYPLPCLRMLRIGLFLFLLCSCSLATMLSVPGKSLVKHLFTARQSKKMYYKIHC